MSAAIRQKAEALEKHPGFECHIGDDTARKIDARASKLGTPTTLTIYRDTLTGLTMKAAEYENGEKIVSVL